MIRTLIICLLAAGASPARAEEAGPPAYARRITQPMVFDGRLDDADWTTAPALTDLREYYPSNGAEAPERTEVRFLYDDRYLYVGIHAFLETPDLLRKPFVRRDKVGSSHDYVQIYIDALGSHGHSYLFRTNARGVKTDGIQDEAAQTESLDPDFDWDTLSRIDESGWTAEMRIPLSTLRIDRSGGQAWTIIVTRGVPRQDNTQMATARFPQNASCFLCYGSPLTFPDLKPAKEKLFVAPSLALTGGHLETGVNAKWLPYGGGAVDLAVHPDFSQVESDSPQLTANARFALDLPEKRPFFREGFDLIATPIPVLYTRTIVDPDTGLRFTHRSANLNGTGFVARDTGRGEIVEPGFYGSQSASPGLGADIAFGHARYALTLAGTAGEGGVLGALKRNADGSFNRVLGLDSSFGTATDRLTAQILASRTRQPDRPDLVADWNGQRLEGDAASVEWLHSGATLVDAKYTRISDGFRGWLGYLPRAGFSEAFLDVRRPFYPRLAGVNDLTPYIQLDRIQPLRGEGRETADAIGMTMSGRHGLSVDVDWHPGDRTLMEDGRTLTARYVQGSVSVNPTPRMASVKLSGSAGEMIDFTARRVVPGGVMTGSVIARPLDRLELSGQLSHSVLGNALTEDTFDTSATWYFNARFYMLADWQGDRSRRTGVGAHVSRISLASVAFTWEISRDFQVYWGVRQDREPSGRDATTSTEAYVKIGRTFSFGA